jgi:hypothetical protein
LSYAAFLPPYAMCPAAVRHVLGPAAVCPPALLELYESLRLVPSQPSTSAPPASRTAEWPAAPSARPLCPSISYVFGNALILPRQMIAVLSPSPVNGSIVGSIRFGIRFDSIRFSNDRRPVANHSVRKPCPPPACSMFYAGTRSYVLLLVSVME